MGLSLLVFGIAGTLVNIVLQRTIDVVLFASMAFLGIIVLFFYE